MPRNSYLALWGLAAALTLRGVGAQVWGAEQDSPALSALLPRMARVATLYRDTTLKFECTETMSFEAHDGAEPPRGYAKFSYLYERDASGKFTNCRMWRPSPTNGGNLRCVDPAEHNIPVSLNNAYLWIFAFLAERQPWINYQLAGEATVFDRRALIVDYSPHDVIRANFNDWYGRAWIDSQSFQLLRVEAYRPQSWEALQKLNRARATPAGVEPPREEYVVETVVTDFGELKNGMRFASEVRLQRSRFSWKTGFKERKLFEVAQRYSKYRFYRVATQEQILGILAGGAATEIRP